jgi:uncharacterized protein (TIGR03435 family)
MALLCLAAQNQEPKPEFEAASVKTAVPLGPLGMRFIRSGGPGTSDPGTYRCQNCSLFQIVLEAYGVKLPLRFSGPSWLQSVRFDISAKLPTGATQEAFQSMLQNLLASRFKLAVHSEKREMRVYELAVARNGPKFKESAPKDMLGDDAPPPGVKRDAEGYPVLPPGVMMAVVPGHARLRSENKPMAWFVEMLSNQMGAPVVDATGLHGKFDFILSWTFEEAGSATDPAGPILPSALQSQLGLKLEEKKGLVEVLVVDRIEKVPTEN